MALLSLLLCSLLAATALATREWARGKEGHARAGDAVLDSLRGEHHEAFGYESHNGPDKWPSMFPACGGQAQSPVDIQLKDAGLLQCPSPLKVPNFEWEENQLRMVNNGHTVMLEPVSPSSVEHLILSGGPLTGEYQLVQLHFHWGTSDLQGSEHSLDGFYAAMEMHMVFSRKTTRRHDRVYRAQDDLVVIGVFLQEVNVANPSLAPVVEQLPQVSKTGASTVLDHRFNTAGLMSPVSGGVLVYKGSLTTPPCSEVVTWLVFRRPVVVSSGQVAQFRKVMSPDGPLKQNRRPVQPLKGRVVYWACTAPAARGRAGRLPGRALPPWRSCWAWAAVLAWAIYC